MNIDRPGRKEVGEAQLPRWEPLPLIHFSTLPRRNFSSVSPCNDLQDLLVNRWLMYWRAAATLFSFTKLFWGELSRNPEYDREGTILVDK